MKALVLFLVLAVAGALVLPAGGVRAQLLITGNDEKVSFDPAGKVVNQPPGKDTVSATPRSMARTTTWLPD
jgi:hypothetical protein